MDRIWQHQQRGTPGRPNRDLQARIAGQSFGFAEYAGGADWSGCADFDDFSLHCRGL
jgi:hypothetical protein